MKTAEERRKEAKGRLNKIRMNKALRTVQNAFADYINRRVDNEIKWAKLRHSYFVTYDYKVEKVDNIATKFAEEVERLAKEDPAVNRE